MPCKVTNERWVGCHLLCDVVLEDLAILGVTVSGSIYGESVKTWMNAAIPEDFRNEIEKAVLVVYHRGSASLFQQKNHAGRRGPSLSFEDRSSSIAEKAGSEVARRTFQLTLG